MTVRDALNSALDEEMSADPKVFLMGEEVGYPTSLYNIILFFLYIFEYELLIASLCPFGFIWLQVGEYQGAYKVSYVFPVALVISGLTVDLFYYIYYPEPSLFVHFRYPRDS